MTIFVRLLEDKDKALGLSASCQALRARERDARVFVVASESFHTVPGAPFAYWVSDSVRRTFESLPAFDGPNRIARVTNPAGDDARFVRAWWEVSNSPDKKDHVWVNFSKGGAFSPFFYDVHLVVRWSQSRQTYHGFIGTEHRPLEKPACVEHFFRPGLTWPRRTQGGLSFRAMPAGGIFADKGPAAFVSGDDPDELLALLALVNSKAFGLLVSLQMAFGSYEVGVVQRTPVPDLDVEVRAKLSALSRQVWSLQRALDTVTETSHAFLAPRDIRTRFGEYDPPEIESAMASILSEIDKIAFDLYGFTEGDRCAAMGYESIVGGDELNVAKEDYDVDEEDEAGDGGFGLLSWAVGVSFGRFDWRLATGERAAPPEPDPFDPLPKKSAGMLPDGLAQFHAHAGILIDDAGHPHDLPHLMEEVLTRVGAPVPDDVRRWLQKDFFPFHLQRYSKSRRKAPIYWPLSTASGNYTLWIYYPSLTSQTLYTAINDFLDGPSGKLKQVGADVTALRNKGSARTRDDEKQFEALQALELELIELRDTLLKIAPTYKPNHDDGVQITAAPLWPLFRHKPWQKLLKETWAKLEKGEYDWSHLAMNYWPARVREKCKTDRSLAIAHDLEHLYVEPEAAPKKPRGRKKRAEHE